MRMSFGYMVVVFVIMGTFVIGCSPNPPQSSAVFLEEALSNKLSGEQKISKYQQGIGAAYFELGQLYVEQGQYKKAAESLESARFFMLKNPDISPLIGKSYRRLGDDYYEKRDDLRAACAYRASLFFLEASSDESEKVKKFITESEAALQPEDVGGNKIYSNPKSYVTFSS